MQSIQQIKNQKPDKAMREEYLQVIKNQTAINNPP